MILIAESGSSKTQWRLVGTDGQIAIETRGINPFFVDEKFVHNELEQSDLRNYKSKVGKIIFYGSGCSSEDRNDYLKNIFKKYFESCAEITVDHDMMAACIALFGDKEGLACIIGTGSNSCVYDGSKIIHNVPALGYVLGDEASGSFIGKEILKHYIYKTLPDEIYQYIYMTYKIDKEDIFESVYKQILPNRYLASYATVAYQYRNTDFIQSILKRGFDEFVDYHVVCYQESKSFPIAAVGSIAAVFKEEFENSLSRYDLVLTKINRNPVDALVHYFINK